MKTLYVYENDRAMRACFRDDVKEIIEKGNQNYTVNPASKILTIKKDTFYYVTQDNLDHIGGLQYNRWISLGDFVMSIEQESLLDSYCRGK